MDADLRQTFYCRHGTWYRCTSCQGTKQYIVQLPNDEYWLNGMPIPCPQCAGVGWLFDMNRDFDFLRYTVQAPCECLKAHVSARKQGTLTLLRKSPFETPSFPTA